MDRIRITGGKPLSGEVLASGAKNAALPEMAACLLTSETVVLKNVPRVADIRTTWRLLAEMGVDAAVSEDGTATLAARDVRSLEAPYELVRTMRASILVLGPLVGRFGRARVSLPGGCAIGARPVNLHLAGLEKMGARCEVVHGYIEATTEGRLRGAEILMEGITVTGTENLMMAAVLAEGETVLDNAACEPEVTDLADLLAAMGARIEGAGTRTLRIQGVPALGGARHRVIPDRIEAGTFATAGAITGGSVTVRGCRPDQMRAVLEQLERAGAEIELPDATSVRVSCPGPIRSRDVVTLAYPGFPTDMQAQYMALMTQGDGTAVITETIFENRFMHALEMIRMGADIALDGRRAVVRGHPLGGASVQASDLRASASLVLAGLVARGETVINRVYHLDRGYDRIEQKLRGLGADIERLT
jgi:UDP-N-acetylglucosamine 1-carboxyvinyltransferase